MTLFRNSQSLLQLRKAAHISQATDVTPNVLGDRIVPIVNIGDRKTNVWTDLTGAGTMYTIPAGKIFNVTYASITFSKLVTDTGTVAFINATDSQGSSKSFIAVSSTNGTTERDTVSITYNPPLEVTSGTIVANIGGTWNVIRFMVGGYYTDNANG